MPLPSGFLRRYRAFLAAAAQDQGIDEAELDRFFIDYPESVLMFLVASRERGGPEGFSDAFRLIDLIEGLGGRVLVVDEPERWDPVVMGIRRGDGALRDLSLTRAACNLARPRLLTILREELAIERATDQAIEIRARAVEASSRLLRKMADQDLPADPNAPTAPAAEEGRRRMTQAILKQRPPGAGPDDDDGRAEPDPLAGQSWSQILQRVAGAANDAGCKDVQIAKVGRGGIVRFSARGPKGARVDTYLAPAVVADEQRLGEILTQKVETAVRAADNLRAAARAVEEAAESAEEPAPEVPSAKAEATSRVEARLGALGYTDVVITTVGGGRYLKVDATDPDGLRLSIAIALRSVTEMDADALEGRLVLLYEQARSDLT